MLYQILKPSQMMPRAARSFLLASVILAGAACDDKLVTAPPPTPIVETQSTGAPLRSKMVVSAAQVLKRTAPLKSPFTASALIGPAGGTLAIPQAGVQVEFARGAVAVPTIITITAAAGKDVAYEFQPHGLRFAAPVTITQDLVKTAAEHDAAFAERLQGSYFEGNLAANLVDAAGSYARIMESRQGKLKPKEKHLEFTIEHFSGYMVSTGLVSVEVSIEAGSR
jgi:hypothetical protein